MVCLSVFSLVQELETQLDALGNLMGVANTSQQRLLELGVPANSSSVDLMTKMAAKFGELKQTASSRRVTIERAMLRFESNVGMAGKGHPHLLTCAPAHIHTCSHAHQLTCTPAHVHMVAYTRVYAYSHTCLTLICLTLKLNLNMLNLNA